MHCLRRGSAVHISQHMVYAINGFPLGFLSVKCEVEIVIKLFEPIFTEIADFSI